MENANEMNQDFSFERELFAALKAKGLLFPTTEKEVEDFEKAFGTTEVPLPEELKDPKSIIGSAIDGAAYSDLQMNMAAFKDNTDNEPFDDQDLKEDNYSPHDDSDV